VTRCQIDPQAPRTSFIHSRPPLHVPRQHFGKARSRKPFVEGQLSISASRTMPNSNDIHHLLHLFDPPDVTVSATSLIPSHSGRLSPLTSTPAMLAASFYKAHTKLSCFREISNPTAYCMSLDETVPRVGNTATTLLGTADGPHSSTQSGMWT